MSVVLATLCLNEMEWLPKLWDQHKDWPEMVRWVFVEAADRAYAKVNPAMVSDLGLSTDGTTDFLRELHASSDLVTHIPHGWTDHADPALGKIAARDQYLQVANKLQPEFVISVDADEFYTKADQAYLLRIMREYPDAWSFTFPRTEIWRPPAYADEPLFRWEVRGGFWGIPCSHWWRWQPGMAYRKCHNTPMTTDGRFFNDRMVQLHGDERVPHMIHLGFAAKRETRLAKNRYYERRGEAKDSTRKWYVHSRAAWEKWKQGVALPERAKVIEYQGPIPEVFQSEV